ncbi:GntR family transcriptional regulator [Allosphingosinicella deserti]|uniref:GntR family transcriptional regulator n=1 Tax=Allosphingosinicella deserti TaxID=2116704 RepID=A0A2P7QKI9_9SPHN|nr:GntR family transcriptional regulator [Sphingomonas deserti]PSJ38473.1 GntR family transcriptional regulator [Sphingomonas deserti]
MRLSESGAALRRDDPQPLYLQLQQLIRSAIQESRIEKDSAIPTERNLSAQFDVSRITVRKAVDGLVDEGLLTRRRGAGTFVLGQRVEKVFSKLSSFSEDMISRGRTPHSIWVSRTIGAVTPEEALSLGLSPGTMVYRFQRIRLADGQPMATERATIPAYCLPSIEVVGDSLYEALSQTGHRPVRALQRLRAISFGKAQADALGVTAGSPGLFIERIGFLADGRAAELTHCHYRGDSYDVVAELHDI